MTSIYPEITAEGEEEDKYEQTLHSSASSTPSVASLRGVTSSVEALTSSNQEEYRSYPQRWLILLSVLLLNLANYSHWISFASVHSKAAEFYQVSDKDIQLILTVSYGLGVPCSCAATFVLSRYGLRSGLLLGGGLTFLGGFLCCVSTFPGLRQLTSPPVWYWASLVGQALTGVGSPFIACVPTKVSQHWFGEGQRPWATAALGLSNPLGLVLGQAITPLFVTRPADIPIMNIVWFVPAFVGGVITVCCVTRSRPPTPPSRSASLETDQEKSSYWSTIKTVMTNKAYLILVLLIGGAMGYMSAQQIKNEPIMCSLGYSNSFSGLSAALVFVGGIIGSVVLGYLFSCCCAMRSVLCAKLLCLPLAAVMVSLVFLLQMPNIGPAIAVALFLLGFFAIGMYPTLLDYAVEATFPADESVITAILFISSSILGVVVMYTDDLLATDIDYSKSRTWNETCTQLNSTHTKPLDHKSYVIFLNCFGLALLLVFVLFFHTKFKRTAANRPSNNNGENNEAVVQ